MQYHKSHSFDSPLGCRRYIYVATVRYHSDETQTKKDEVHNPACTEASSDPPTADTSIALADSPLRDTIGPITWSKGGRMLLESYLKAEGSCLQVEFGHGLSRTGLDSVFTLTRPNIILSEGGLE